MVEQSICKGKRRYSLPTAEWLHSRRSEMNGFAHHSTIVRAGSYNYTADGASLLLLFSDILTKNTSTTYLNDYYVQLFETGCGEHMRTFGQGTRSQMYNAKGFSSAIAENIGINEQELRRQLRAFRATVVYEAQSDPSIDQNDVFRKSIGALFEQDQSLPPSQRDERFVDVMTKWDGSVVGFYRIIGQQKANGQWLGRFFPYEIDFFLKVAKKMQIQNSQSHFTRKLMSEMLRSRNIKKTAQTITEETGMSIDTSVLDDYIYLLSFDFPGSINPSQSK